MAKPINLDSKEFCLKLLKADTEKGVINIFNEADYWDNPEVWRYYGGRASNFNTIGNQQSKSDAALVEKLVNSVDARLINECLMNSIDPEGPDAPSTVREAVAKFFDDGSQSSAAGLIREWPDVKRTEIAKGITLSATGNKPKEGNPCFVISDCGEGQTPDTLPTTILSLDRDNKVKIPFVQGKFNMGGTGVLEFCGKRNLQLVLSRRNPNFVKSSKNLRDHQWGFTVVRREDPIGGRKTSVYTFLAPLESETFPREGKVLSFSADSMPIFPAGRNPYGRSSSWGTLIKVYEYSTAGFSGTNILLDDGLMRRLDLLLTDLALPIRLYECRDYGGHKGSYDTNLTGIGVRLEDDKGNNLEDVPYSCSMQVAGEKMTANIYVFKKGKDKTYRSSEGIIFSVNGQTHGHLKTDFFRRNKVGMSYLKDSILVTIDCSEISQRSRELLFMPSRDRLREGELSLAIEKELEEILSNHQGLRELREKRRREELESILNDAKPLEDILEELIKDSPTLSKLFLMGTRISNPFKVKGVGVTPNNFAGKKFPTYFKFENIDYGEILNRSCHINMRARITFETDAENMYFSRNINPGSFSLYLLDGKKSREVNHTINLWNGIATLNVPMPEETKEGDKLRLRATINDHTRLAPFENIFTLEVLAASNSKSTKRERRKPPSDEQGNEREKPVGIELPNIVQVASSPGPNQKSWDSMTPPFNVYSALRITHAGVSNSSENGKAEVRNVYDYYVNVDNIYLKTEQKTSKENAELLQAKYVYGLVLMGLALVNYEGQQKASNGDNQNNLEERVEKLSEAISAVLLPIINDLGNIELED
jgi:hypothetical protein